MKKMFMGVAIGAGAMYLLDPDHGAERRGKLLGFYSENKDTFQDYAQTATQTAVTVSQTAASAASTVAEKAGELAGKGDSTASKSSNGKGSGTKLDSLVETRDTAPGNTSLGTGGSLGS